MQPTSNLIKAPVYPTPLPYVGPGLDNLQSNVSPGQSLLADRIRSLSVTPAGGSSIQPLVQPTKAAVTSLLNVEASHGMFGSMLLYSPLLTHNTYNLIDFSDPVCFPLAASAIAAPQALPATTPLVDLSSYIWGSQANGTGLGEFYPTTATSATAAPLTYGLTGDGKSVCIIFTDSNVGSVAEAINLNPTGNVSNPSASSVDTAFLWAIAFETPATLSTGNGALFCLGATMATQQIAFCVVGGVFGAYVNGGNFVSFGITAAVSTKYALGIFIHPDDANPGHYEVVLYSNALNARTVVKKSIPYPINVTPWNDYTFQPRAMPATDGVMGFGPQPAYGGQWAFNAVGSFTESFSTAYSVDPFDRFFAFYQLMNVPQLA